MVRSSDLLMRITIHLKRRSYRALPMASTAYSHCGSVVVLLPVMSGPHGVEHVRSIALSAVHGSDKVLPIVSTTDTLIHDMNTGYKTHINIHKLF